MNRSTRKFALRGLLAAHFAPVRLEDLVITRHDFPHWMRPDLQKALEAIFAAMPRHRFFGARLRGGEPWFRFADLVEPGAKAPAIGPAEYQDADIGEDQPVRCLTRGLWLSEGEGMRFALLLDVSEGYRAPRARLEISVPQGEAPARFAGRLAERLRAQAERGDSWRGKVLMLDRAHDDFELSAAGLRVIDAVAVQRDEIVLPERTLALIERNTLGFAHEVERLARLGLSARKGVLLYGPPGTGKTLVVRWLAGALKCFTSRWRSRGRSSRPLSCWKISISSAGTATGPGLRPAEYSTRCSMKWTDSGPKRAFYSCLPPTGRKCWNRRSRCGPAAWIRRSKSACPEKPSAGCSSGVTPAGCASSTGSQKKPRAASAA